MTSLTTQRCSKVLLFKKDRFFDECSVVTDSDELNAKFVSESKAQGFVNLKGHRTVGMRASIYNAMPIEGVKALVDFMTKFEKREFIMYKIKTLNKISKRVPGILGKNYEISDDCESLTVSS